MPKDSAAEKVQNEHKTHNRTRKRCKISPNGLKELSVHVREPTAEGPALISEELTLTAKAPIDHKETKEMQKEHKYMQKQKDTTTRSTCKTASNVQKFTT